jgi:hypothetical protein
MPLTTANDISVVLSGGTVNIDPNASIGGDPSSSPIQNDVLNNLFADVTTDQSKTGFEDYRCVYIFNDGQTPVYAIKLWIASDFIGGSTMELGVENRDETQRITISGGVVTGGSFTISYLAQNIVSNYNSDLGVWATALETSINALVDVDSNPIFDDAQVVAQNVGVSTIIFDIKFSGLDAKRNLDKFLLIANNLTPSPTINLVITAPSEGAPINTIAPEINQSTTPPGGVGFFAASEASPITLPMLKPNEGFPLWVKRSTPAGVTAQERDGMILRFRAESLEPAS